MKRFLAFVLLVLSILIGINHGALAGLTAATVSGAALMPVHNGGTCFILGPLNLLDLALRSGKHVKAVLDGVLISAPELNTFATLPQDGLSYETMTVTGLPSGDFRKVGEGVGLQKSEWKRSTQGMVPFEAQMRVPEDVLLVAKMRNKELTDGDILAAEAIRHVRGSSNKIGAQTWYGKKESNGFIGLSTQVDAAFDMNVGGANNTDTSSAYFVDLDANPANPEGVHYVLGNSGRMTFKEMWLELQEKVTSDPETYRNIFANNFLAFIGLIVNRPEAIYRARNINAANVFDDLKAAELLSKIPLVLRSNKSRMRCFMNSYTHFLLHKARITAGAEIGKTYVPEPTEVCGIPIVLTDSLVTTERNGVKP